MKFIHAADVHLDSPMRGLEEYAGAPIKRLRLATRTAMDNVVHLCLTEQVDFLVIAGDLFDTACRDFNSALSAAAQMQKLNRAGIPVYLILGNHDSRDEMARQVPWPANVTLFDHKQPHTVRHPSLPVAIHGMSYPRREVTENLVPEYPAPIPDCFNIGLLHTNAGGNPLHDAYAPSSVEELSTKGYHYWALGHVHDYAVLHERPWVVYSGTTQGRHAKEVGLKGCLLVHVDNSHEVSLEFRETDVMRWYRETVTLQADDDEDLLLERTRQVLRQVTQAADGRLAAVRLLFEGRCAVHQQLCRDASRQQIIANLRGLAGDFGDDVWIERIQFRTQSPLSLDAMRMRQDLVGDLLRDIASIAQDPARLLAMSDLLKPLAARAGADLAPREDNSEMIQFDDPELLAGWLRDAEELLLSHLAEEST
ncbi:MAG: DNA repair exonuclease [Planctomycetes bacterium]|nr:DNA repair exonuclease [Planctomycetota bacterium]